MIAQREARGTPVCPVCGFAGLYEEAWDGVSPSYEICPCCGTQFGYDDATPDPRDRPAKHELLRGRWVESGRLWFYPSGCPPEGWDPAAQLARYDDDRRR